MENPSEKLKILTKQCKTDKKHMCVSTVLGGETAHWGVHRVKHRGVHRVRLGSNIGGYIGSGSGRTLGGTSGQISSCFGREMGFYSGGTLGQTLGGTSGHHRGVHWVKHWVEHWRVHRGKHRVVHRVAEFCKNFQFLVKTTFSLINCNLLQEMPLKVFDGFPCKRLMALSLPLGSIWTTLASPFR